MKVCFSVDHKTQVELEGKEIEPEIVIRTTEGLLVEIFGTEEGLKEFATKLYKATHE
ncbi:hypothetical protein [Bacillus sp. M6-12]|uniref:hypothetical protein n=1 Tax=Bacillus sp. M6-12 TaxID=2054166 RepID=UPI0015E1480D|nr:hypothetical protein [Bacillus sp. M6-12]